MSTNMKEMKAFADKLNKMAKDSPEKTAFMESCAKALASRLLSRVIKRTPVDSGELRKGWTGGKQNSATAWAENLTIKRVGKVYQITVSNPVGYAPFVEYGHRHVTRNRKVTGWVPGQYMLTLSTKEVESLAPALLQKRLRAFLTEHYG